MIRNSNFINWIFQIVVGDINFYYLFQESLTQIVAFINFLSRVQLSIHTRNTLTHYEYKRIVVWVDLLSIDLNQWNVVNLVLLIV